MSIRPIHNEQDYDKALNIIDELMDLNPPLNTPQSDELPLEILV